jgi:WhiB family redox-sensing transcriptional regulator
MTRQPSPEQIRRRRERDRVNHARARARAAGRDPEEIPRTDPTLRRVVLPVSRAQQTGWQDGAACRTSPPQWFDAETDEDAAQALAVCAGCQVRRECYLAAAADRAQSGVWGGVDLSAADRAAGKAVAS